MDSDRPWTSLPISEYKQMAVFFNASVRYILGSGTTFLFWVDPWLDGMKFVDIALDLVQVAPARCRKQQSVASALNGMSWAWDVAGALTVTVLVQYVLLYRLLHLVQLNPNEPNCL
jgi:hypothetical protein